MASGLLDFPTELLLKTIEYLPFENGATVANLMQTHPRFRGVLNRYENSVTANWIMGDLPHALSDFPLRENEKTSYTWLKECVEKYDVIDEVMARLTTEENCMAAFPHIITAVYTGMLLLCRVSSLTSHKEKLTFLKSLPLDPLSAICFAIHHCTFTTRYFTSPPLLRRYSYSCSSSMDVSALSIRSDLEIALAEGCLQHGPAFIHSILYDTHSSAKGETTLLNIYHDTVLHDWDLKQGTGEWLVKPPVTQGPLKEVAEETLWLVVWERMADLSGCAFEEVKANIERDCDFDWHRLGWLSASGKRRLLRGENLEVENVENVV